MPAASIRIAVAGALGRMGRTVARIADEREGIEVAALFDQPGSEGREVDGRVLVTQAGALKAVDVIIDFTTGAASAALAREVAGRGGPALVIGSTGFSPDEEAKVTEAAARVAIVKAGNFSLGVNMLLGLVRQASRALGPQDWDIEVFEAHHRRKVDAPSGTALMLGEAAAEGRGAALASLRIAAREGITGPRREGGIGFSVARGGGIVGEHAVSFASEDEIITFAHSARDRSLFARGAVAAAAWVAQRPAGLYDMQDVLGLGQA